MIDKSGFTGDNLIIQKNIPFWGAAIYWVFYKPLVKQTIVEFTFYLVI